MKLTSNSGINYRSFIGRAPKKYIVGELLDYEALYIGEVKKNKNYQNHRFLVEDKFIEHSGR
ncbi:hypothetical protein FIB49_13140 [Lactococcus cremoris]|uniref:hypothetical protein n=1 Tax=Lactococcus TaxID=1357 RepID=UPI00031F6D0E|nr:MULTISPECIES: hypothetical protein [Lactococcus]KZK44966.1 hypothetical protein SK110_2158 [Lactococcus cremoris]KZK53204.1 hypothetical protein AM2_1700 [Lactococcus cremoris]MCT4408479.1 hypothetical protein [Lactococcus cremoris]MCT4424477.1 hypothetical protein [Lactococcus cremoris]MCT4427256.1 hypothetical protein [Lactococcus cremoris]